MQDLLCVSAKNLKEWLFCESIAISDVRCFVFCAAWKSFTVKHRSLGTKTATKSHICNFPNIDLILSSNFIEHKALHAYSTYANRQKKSQSVLCRHKCVFYLSLSLYIYYLSKFHLHNFHYDYNIFYLLRSHFSIARSRLFRFFFLCTSNFNIEIDTNTNIK